MGIQDRGRALEDENRPQLNSVTTFNNLIIVNKRGWLGAPPNLTQRRGLFFDEGFDNSP